MTEGHAPNFLLATPLITLFTEVGQLKRQRGIQNSKIQDDIIMQMCVLLLFITHEAGIKCSETKTYTVT